MVSKTLITPGCRNVLDLRTAFFARGRRDLFALISNTKTLQAEPSSCILSHISHCRSTRARTKRLHTRFVPLCKAQTESPISTLSPKGERKSTTLRDGGSDGRFEEIHGRGCGRCGSCRLFGVGLIGGLTRPMASSFNEALGYEYEQ